MIWHSFGLTNRPTQFLSYSLSFAAVVIAAALGPSAMAGSETIAPPPGGPPAFGNQPFVIPPAEIPKLQEEALKGSGKAAYKLSQFYYMVTLDFKAGLYWLTIAAENGDLNGIYGLGYQLRFNNDTQSKIRARYWLNRAINEGLEPIPTLAKGVLKEMDETQK